MRRELVTRAKALTPAKPAGSIDGNDHKDGQSDQLYQE
jgi:hypothetical protein